MKSPVLNRPRIYMEPERTRREDFMTGRFLVTSLDKGAGTDRIREAITRKAGMRSARTSDFYDRIRVTENDYLDADAFIYDELGIAVVGSDEDQSTILSSISSEYNFIMEPEEVVFEPVVSEIAERVTWGLWVTGAENSRYTGQGVKVAVLDTGFAPDHPDFDGRKIVVESFVPGEDATDLNGHGTHCAGTACGNEDHNGTRYGVAGGADIYIGKALGGVEGIGTDSWIISAIMWAAKSGCPVISMSLGVPVNPGQSYKRAYERVARYAIENGSLIIAAAGNESLRDMGIVNPVAGPANCPSVMAVGAIDSSYI